jgi:hypothetical protein
VLFRSVAVLLPAARVPPAAPAARRPVESSRRTAPRGADERRAAAGADGARATARSEPRPRIDWLASAERLAREAYPGADARPRAQFALPPAHPPMRPQAEFGWSHARTHPIEYSPGGPLILNVSDRCSVVVLLVLPVPVCSLRKGVAAGDLFERMRRPRSAGDWQGPEWPGDDPPAH